MKRMRTAGLLLLIMGVLGFGFQFVFAESYMLEDELREEATKLQGDGNYKEAFDIFSELAISPDSDAAKVPGDFTRAVECLRQLNRHNEIDAFREKVIAAHPENWRLLWKAAYGYYHGGHDGYMIAGEFRRGQHRGGGRYANARDRDRVRALQLMQQAMQLGLDGYPSDSLQQFYHDLADMIMGYRGYGSSWQLQYLTNLAELPDYETGYYRHGATKGAPVDADGNPIYYYAPKSWEAAENDGQRWRWTLEQIAANGYQADAKSRLAGFLHNQFGVQTMAHSGLRFGRWGETDEKKSDTGTWDLHTLKENETIARLASGIKRFTLPDEFCYIRLYRELRRNHELVSIFNNRRQYDKSVEILESLPRAAKSWEKNQYDQIVKNWGRFEPVMTQPADDGATVDFRFRNATRVKFTAHKIDIEKLLTNVKDYIKSRPADPNHNYVQIGNIGYQLVQKNQKQYLGKKVADWTLELKPRGGHFDKRITVNTPLQKAGAYLLTAQMPDGNTSNIVLWISDTAIVHKPRENKNWYLVADAISGKPIAKANVEFFGYERLWNRPKSKDENGYYSWKIKNFSQHTGENGQVIVDSKQMLANHQWMIVARTDSGRLAYLGWSGTWYHRIHDRSYNQTKTFIMTDRSVYRPGQKVNFKFWMAHAKYDIEGQSQFAGQSAYVRIHDPKGQKFYEHSFVMDNYGGAGGDFELKKDATLGVYRIHVPHGWLTFRVEEYKKPEFEVKVEAPTHPVMLGEKITAKIVAKYYFGSPVTEAKVKYKIFRTSHSANWYPAYRWDWLFGSGYGWLGYDCHWLPGWNSWGCKRPIPWWWGWRPSPRPEMIAENEVQIGADGTVDIEIDTAIAKALQGDTDHRYEIKAEVTDSSRRTIVANGAVLVARRPFKVYAWVDRGFYRTGDTVRTNFQARTLDGNGVKGSGALELMKISYKDGKPVETCVQKWNLATDDDGLSQQQITASQPGQYRLSYKVTDAKEHTIEGGYVFSVWGKGDTGENFRFNAIEIVPDKVEYKPGEKVRLRINTNLPDSTVLLFIRPSNGVYLPPKVLHLQGRSTEEIIEVGKKDMPNFFVEAVTVSGARVHTEVRQIVVPPEKRVLSVKVTPDKTEYKPGEKGKVTVELRDANGEPFVGSVVLTMYDKAVEYISGGPNVPDIVSFFWKWKRSHNPVRDSSLTKSGRNIYKDDAQRMRDLGVFGRSVADESGPISSVENRSSLFSERRRMNGSGPMVKKSGAALVLAMSPMSDDMSKTESLESDAAPSGGDAGPTVRTKFADTALWVGSLTTGADGTASVDLTMPENLTTWKTTAWAMGNGTRVGTGTAESVTTKNVIVRLQAPRFFVQTDEVVLSAVVHNYLKTAKSVRVTLQISGESPDERIVEGVVSTDAGVRIEPSGIYMPLPKTVEIPAGGEQRVDWRVKVLREGVAKITMSAVTDEESDAMLMEFPVYVHGMLKTDSFCGAIRPKDKQGTITIDVPEARRPKESRLEVRYSPTLAGAMIDAIPYLVEYPYGCTEQTLNRFLPTVITQQTLLEMKVDLADIQKHITNLNAQEISNSTDAKRVADWKRLCGEKRWDGEKWVARNPVFSKEVVDDMVKVGLTRLTNMQCDDGGWGWFSGWGERSYPHTTAVVVHGLQIAKANGVAVVPGVLNRGVAWLKQYQDEQLRRLKLWESGVRDWPAKQYADNLDALVYRVLVDAKVDDPEMRKRIYRDRLQISVYSKCLLAIACHNVKDIEKRDMLIRNVSQFLVQDDENQTAYLQLPQGSYWWCWYGSEIEANAAYLKLLTLTDPKGATASRLVKYLLNNRRHGTYWNSTRDTAYCLEAFADFIRTSGEAKPDMTVEVLVDGKLHKQVKITAENLFSFDNKFVLTGTDVTTGKHTITIRRQGSGSVYFNAYLTNFTLEDPIDKAGLEVKVTRKYFKLVPVDKTVKAAGSHGQVLDQRVEKYDRIEIPGPFAKGYKGPTMLKSGDLVDIELTIESKNDYEYIMFEDMKAAGFEPVSIRSGYGDNEMGAYMELRDNRVTFFVRRLARGKHSITYRMRAEIPGKFSALPAKASAMYAPELKANSNEMKIAIED